VKKKLGELGKLDQGHSVLGKTIDPKTRESSFNSRLVAGGEGFEPPTKLKIHLQNPVFYFCCRGKSILRTKIVARAAEDRKILL
jgi:hypothetical protein